MGPSPPFRLFSLLALCLLLAMCTAGCATPVPESQGPGPDAVISCDTGQELTVPTGTTSESLEELIFAAYKDARALLLSCAAKVER